MTAGVIVFVGVTTGSVTVGGTRFVGVGAGTEGVEDALGVGGPFEVVGILCGGIAIFVGGTGGDLFDGVA